MASLFRKKSSKKDVDPSKDKSKSKSKDKENKGSKKTETSEHQKTGSKINLFRKNSKADKEDKKASAAASSSAKNTKNAKDSKQNSTKSTSNNSKTKDSTKAASSASASASSAASNNKNKNDNKKNEDNAKPRLSSKQLKQANSETGKKLDWKFGQRSDVTELVARGIVSDEYTTVLKGDKDIDDAKLEHEKTENASKQQIDKVLKYDLRPSADEIEDRGIAPHGSLAGANKKENEYDDWAVKKAEFQKKKAKQKLEQKFGQRMQPDEAVARNIIEQDALEKDYEKVESGQKTDKKKLAAKLAGKIGQRPDAKEVVARGIASDEKEFFEDYDKVEKKKKNEKKKNMDALNNWKRPSPDEIAKKTKTAAAADKDDEKKKESKPPSLDNNSGNSSNHGGGNGGNGGNSPHSGNTSPRTPGSPKTIAERRRAESTSLKNLNYTISTRPNYRRTYKFDSETCIVLFKDETIKSHGNNNNNSNNPDDDYEQLSSNGYIYYNENTDKVCNDGNDNSSFDQTFLWEITIINWKEWKKTGAVSPRASSNNNNNNKNKKEIEPLFYIKSLGSGGYLRSINKVAIKKTGKNGDIIEDDGSTFGLQCCDKDIKSFKKHSFLWTIDKIDGFYTIHMVNGKTHKPLKDQFLTFGKSIKIDEKKTSYRLPKTSKLRIFK